MFHGQFEHQNVANSMENERFELINAPNTVEIAPSSSKMLNAPFEGENRWSSHCGSARGNQTSIETRGWDVIWQCKALVTVCWHIIGTLLAQGSCKSFASFALWGLHCLFKLFHEQFRSCTGYWITLAGLLHTKPFTRFATLHWSLSSF